MDICDRSLKTERFNLKLAAIDIGSNAARLLITEVVENINDRITMKNNCPIITKVSFFKNIIHNYKI
jgi:exopolyphosphatase/pppGpp-phosphohydrolase